MKVSFSGIKNCFKQPGNLIAKGVGLAALGLACYDAHYIGKIQADLYSSERDANASAYYLNNSMYSTNMSKIQDGIREAAYTMELDQGWRRFFNSGIGYIKGFTSMMINDVVPVFLGAGALLTKGAISKTCAAGVGIYGVYQVIKNFFGMGTPKGMNGNF